MENSCLGWKFHSSLNSERFRCIRSSKQSSVVSPFTEITLGNVRIGFYSTPDWIENCCNWLFVSYIFTTLSSIQHCLHYNIVFIVTLSSIQHCLHYNIVFISALSSIQHCLIYNIVFITTLYSLQHCLPYNIVFKTTLSSLQHCLFYRINKASQWYMRV